MICLNCQSLNEESDAFCRNCGAALTNAADAPTIAYQTGSQAVVASLSGALLGQAIDERYRLDAVIGNGGMGTVYRATRLKIGDLVAVKVLHPERLADPQAIARFRREAQAAAVLKHPNAVTVYDFGVTPQGLCYLVMELVNGMSLRQLLGTHGPLAAKAAADMMTQVCAALDEAHRQGIIHRDLKPDNIIVQQGPAGMQVKVLDFGIAKMEDAGNRSLTVTGSVMGTPHYMSPEQCLGEELDLRSDVYSLGIVLYEMLTGSVPFKSPTSTAVVVQHVNQPPTPLRALNLSVPPAVEAVVLHALAKRREERPASAGILAQELNAAANTGAAPIYNSPPAYSAPVPAFGNYAMGEGVTATGAVQPSGAPPTLVMPQTPPSGQQIITPVPSFGGFPGIAPLPTQGKNRTGLYVLSALLLVSMGVGAYFLFSTKNAGGPWPDHLGLFARQSGGLTELPRKDFTNLVKGCDELAKDAALPVTTGQVTMILYAQAQDTPASDLKLVQVDSIEKDGKARYWNFQVAPASGRPDMRELKVAGGLPSGKYAFALINGFADEGTHKLWPFQVKDGVAQPSETAQTITLSVKPKTPEVKPGGVATAPPGSMASAPAGPRPLPPIGGYAYPITGNVLLRGAPSLSGAKVDKLARGQSLLVLGYSDNTDIWRGQQARWILVRTDYGVTGYVFSGLVR